MQQRLDNELGIHIEPLTAAFPTARVDAIGGSLTDKAASDETLKRRMDAPVRNVTDSFYTDYVEANADFRSRAGLKTTITRQTNGKCCDCCAALAGHYVYPDVPENIWAFHDNCTCSLLYSSAKTTSMHGKRGKSRYKDVLTGKEREKALKNAAKPVRFTRQQAENLQNNVLSGVANSGNGGIIESRGYYDVNENLISITHDTIDSIPMINQFSTLELNQKVQNLCRELLHDLINAEVGTEESIGVSIDSDSTIKKLGETGAGGVEIPKMETPYVTIHNHPSGKTFSVKDFDEFAYDDKIKAVVVVGNNGKIYSMIKNEDFSPTGFFEEFSPCKNLQSEAKYAII